jgi:hypothetical protein
VANDPQTDKPVLVVLGELVATMLADWPPDADAWIGERAQGLHTYELIRDGYLLSVLSYREIRDLRDEVGIATLGETVAKTIDSDQLFYLRRMRTVIDCCERPYWQRRATLNELDKQMEQRRKTTAYPFVADQILDVDIQRGQRLQALDLARCQAWHLALATATGDDPESLGNNPLTGKAYEIKRDGESVSVDGVRPEGGAPEMPIRVRLPQSTEK